MINLTAEFRGVSALARRLKMVSERAKAKLRIEVDRAGWEAVRVARALVPVKTGKLRSTIRFIVYRTNRGLLGFQGRLVAGSRQVRYARFVEEGTRPHKIPKTPKTDGFLAWEGDDGEAHFARQVSHPGTDPQPFLRPARRILEGVLRERLHQMVKDVGRRFRSGG